MAERSRQPQRPRATAGRPQLKEFARTLRVYDQRAASGESARAHAFVRERLTPEMVNWSREDWLHFGGEFGRQFRWQWSQLFGLLFVEAAGDDIDGVLLIRCFYAANLNPTCLVGSATPRSGRKSRIPF